MLNRLTYPLVALVGVLHLVFAYREAFSWPSTGPRFFPDTEMAFFERPEPLIMAQNQAIYNVALGLAILSVLLISDPLWKRRIGLGSMAAVVLVGIVGWITVGPVILALQVAPAVVAGVLLLLVK